MKFNCEHCGHRLEANPEHFGKVLQCPVCSTPTLVPVACFDAPIRPNHSSVTRAPVVPSPHKSGLAARVVVGCILTLLAGGGAFWFFLRHSPGESPVQLVNWETPESLPGFDPKEKRRIVIAPAEGKRLLVAEFKVPSDLLLSEKSGSPSATPSLTYSVYLGDFVLCDSFSPLLTYPATGGKPLLDPQGTAPFTSGQVLGQTSASDLPGTENLMTRVTLYWFVPEKVIQESERLEIRFRDFPPMELSARGNQLTTHRQAPEEKITKLELPIGEVKSLFQVEEAVPHWKPEAGNFAAILWLRTSPGLKDQGFVAAKCALRDPSGRTVNCAGIWIHESLYQGGDSFSIPEPISIGLVFSVSPDQTKFDLLHGGRTLGSVTLVPGTIEWEERGSFEVTANEPENALWVYHTSPHAGGARGFTGTLKTSWSWEKAVQDDSKGEK